MNRKDYNAIADIIAAQRARYCIPCTDVETIDNIARGIADHCADTMQSFDRPAFLRACKAQG